MPELDAFDRIDAADHVGSVDPFERRFATAYGRYLDEAPTGVDAAAAAHAAAAARPGRLAPPWTLRPMPALAWLVLLGLLLAALAAAVLFVGSQRHAIAFACPPGSTPDEPGPADQARPVIGDGVAAMVYDRRAGKVVLLAQVLGGPETWTFDVCTNTWTRMHPDREPGSPLGEATHTIYDVDSDATIAIDGESTWVYDLAADTWTRMGAPPAVRQWNTLTWTYDPVSGLVLAADAAELWSYDVETDTWAWVSAVPWPSGRGAITYDASIDRIVAYADSRELWLFDIRTGTWSRPGADTPEVVCGMGWPNPRIVYDELAERSVVSCNITVAYDASADRWESLPADAGPFGMYDCVNERFVGFESDSLFAFDPATRERIVLLEASEAQPTPSSE